jgi:hypothetical protein
MNRSWTLACLLALGISCASPGPAAAGKCAGTNINHTVSWDQTEIAKGTKLATWRGASVVVAEDTNAPYHLVAGECIGIFLTNPDGKTQASGFCSRRDKDGDVLHEEWISTDGTGAKGTFKNVGGTGKFARTANTGQWEGSSLQGKMGAARWVGDCQ